MARAAMVEGTETPSVYLRRGQRRIVPWTSRWQRLIDGGFVRVLGSYEVRLGRRGPDD